MRRVVLNLGTEPWTGAEWPYATSFPTPGVAYLFIADGTSGGREATRWACRSAWAAGCATSRLALPFDSPGEPSALARLEFYDEKARNALGATILSPDDVARPGTETFRVFEPDERTGVVDCLSGLDSVESAMVEFVEAAPGCSVAVVAAHAARYRAIDDDRDLERVARNLANPARHAAPILTSNAAFAVRSDDSEFGSAAAFETLRIARSDWRSPKLPFLIYSEGGIVVEPRVCREALERVGSTTGDARFRPVGRPFVRLEVRDEGAFESAEAYATVWLRRKLDDVARGRRESLAASVAARDRIAVVAAVVRSFRADPIEWTTTPNLAERLARLVVGTTTSSTELARLVTLSDLCRAVDETFVDATDERTAKRFRSDPDAEFFADLKETFP